MNRIDKTQVIGEVMLAIVSVSVIVLSLGQLV